MHGLTGYAGVAIVVILMVSAAAAVRKARMPQAAKLRSKPLLTGNETAFFRQLEHALPGYRVFPQVAFAAFLTEDSVLPPKTRQGMLNTFDQKKADFVVCNRNTLQIVALVELDARTHLMSRDRKRDELLQSAGYRTIRFRSKHTPSAAEIAALFAPSTTSSVDTKQVARR